jgi:glycosyltransferase involved in cell wall biosynthesis
VEFPGYVPYHEAPAAYRRGDLFVSPTYGEGFSNTILEAMATGLPVVSTRAVGVVDCLRHGENALLVEVGDVEMLAVVIGALLDDRDLRRRISEKALEEARTLYAWPAVAKQISAVYRSLAGTRPDTDWSADGAVVPCRFREAPHLL